MNSGYQARTCSTTSNIATTQNPGSNKYYNSPFPVSGVDVGFQNQAQYWPMFSGGEKLPGMASANANTAVNTGSKCANALKESIPTKRNSTLYSDTTGTCCLTNDLMYLACYACFDCVGLFKNANTNAGIDFLNALGVSFYSCNAATVRKN